MEKKLTILVAVCISLVSCVHVKPTDSSNNYPGVSMVQLLATPEKFDGKAVTVRGFYHAEFESVALYLSRDDARFITQNSVSLGTVAKSASPGAIANVNDTYVVISGIFLWAPPRTVWDHGERWLMDIKTRAVATPRSSMDDNQGLR